MSATEPRLRMFAGPNGSGKSTLKSYLPPALLGIYLNPDELEQEIRRQNFLDFAAYGLNGVAEAAQVFFASSSFLATAGLTREASRLDAVGDRVNFNEVKVNSYFASVACDFIRQQLISRQTTITFETVMSHPGKVDLLAQAQAAGYRTYLYFVATDDPAINVSRVKNRVQLGGHDVPEQKIVERYHRSLDLLYSAIRFTDRAYVFDNSGDNAEGHHTWLAEITNGRRLELKTDRIPAWFDRSVLQQIK